MVACVACLMLVVAGARVEKEPDYGRMCADSDIVVIGQAIGATTVPFDVNAAPWRTDDGRIRAILEKHLSAVVTMIRVDAVLKGDVAGPEIQVFHYSWKVKPTAIDNAPVLLHLPPALKARRTYMLFLRQRDDMLWEPVSGHLESHLSVAELKHQDEPEEQLPGD